MTGISNISSDPLLSSITPRGIATASRVAGRVDPLNGNADSVSVGSVSSVSEESSGVYSEREILAGKLQNGSDGTAGANGLDDSERQMVQDLAARDREVRSHESAHAALLGRYAVGGPTYSFQVGPDGKAYAVGGSITADVGRESTPEATAAKARIIARAAMGGGASSGADRSVAAAANRMGIQAIA